MSKLEKYFERVNELKESQLEREIAELSLFDLKAIHKEAIHYLAKAREERASLEAKNKEINKQIQEITEELQELCVRFVSCVSREEEAEIDSLRQELKGKKALMQTQIQDLYDFSDGQCDSTGRFNSAWPPSRLDISAWMVFHTRKSMKANF